MKHMPMFKQIMQYSFVFLGTATVSPTNDPISGITMITTPLVNTSLNTALNYFIYL